MARPRAILPLPLLLALALLGAGGAGAIAGGVVAFGTGTIWVYDANGHLGCTDATPISVGLAFPDAPPDGVEAPTGYYVSVSGCSSFAYPLATERDCTGGPGTTVRCEEDGPPREFTLEPDGAFEYLRWNLGFEFVVRGELTRLDA